MLGKSILIRDRITNMDAADEPFMLLYHCNFGYTLLDACAHVLTTPANVEPLNPLSTDPAHMMEPVDGRGEELYFCHAQGEHAVAMLHNPECHIAGYVRLTP